MADPQIVGGIRVIVELRASDEAEEDVFVNTWAFGTFPAAPVAQSHIDDAVAALDTFYTSLGSRFGAQVGHIQATAYNLGEAPPRTPVGPVTLLAPSTTVDSLPSEVALCLTFHNGTTPRPRNRGRVYLGPLRADQNGLDGQRPVPTLALRTAVAGAASTLAATTTSVRWGVLSQRDGVIRQVDQGWIDDAWDIQRRRGEDAVNRSLWS